MLLTEDFKKDRLKRAYSGFRNVPEKLHRATQALFWEHRHACRWKKKNFHPPYNLGKKDHDDTLSMAQIYFQCPSEYEAALILLGDWEHWEKLTSCGWFMPHILKWRAEKAQRDAAMARGLIADGAAKGDRHWIKYLDQQHTNSVQRIKEVKEVEPEVEEKEESNWAAAMLKKVGGASDT